MSGISSWKRTLRGLTKLACNLDWFNKATTIWSRDGLREWAVDTSQISERHWRQNGMSYSEKVHIPPPYLIHYVRRLNGITLNWLSCVNSSALTTILVHGTTVEYEGQLSVTFPCGMVSFLDRNTKIRPFSTEKESIYMNPQFIRIRFLALHTWIANQYCACCNQSIFSKQREAMKTDGYATWLTWCNFYCEIVLTI